MNSMTAAMARKAILASLESRRTAVSGLLKAKTMLVPSIAKLLPKIVAPVLTGTSSRPLWFDGRFLAAQDMAVEQDYFLQRQNQLGRAAGSGVVHGLWVDQGATISQPADPETIVVHAGVGITPSGALVMISTDLTIRLSDLASEQTLDDEFGLSEAPRQPSRTRTGLYVVALRPVQFTANPISFYPAGLQSPRTTHDGDVVEASAVALIPFDNPVNAFDASLQQAALARQIFLGGGGPALPDSLLPLAMVSIDRDTVKWIDPYLVRRDSASEPSSLPGATNDRAERQAFLLQYDAMLQSAVANQKKKKSNARLAASDYFHALPSAGRFPIDAIDVTRFTHVFFPPQTKVQLGIVPADELPAFLEDSLSLPSIDLTLPPAAFANLSVFAFVAVPRSSFATLQSTLTPVTLNPALPQLLLNRSPLHLLTQLQDRTKILHAEAASSSAWQAAIAGQTYGFYIVRRSEPVFPDFSVQAAVSDEVAVTHALVAATNANKPAKTLPRSTTTAQPRTTAAATTTTTPKPLRTKPPLTTTTPAPKRTERPATTVAARTTTPKVTTTPRN